MVESATASEDGRRSDGDEVAFGEPLVEVDGLTKYFNQDEGFLASFFGTEQVRAVEDVSFEIRKGETLGLVGESGCGKSTLARTILRLVDPTEGSVYFKGRDLASLSGEQLRAERKDAQMIFQDPQSSLDPRMKVGQIVEEPMRAHDMLDAEGRRARARELLEAVGLDPLHYNRYPHQFSGGQRQRVNLARALSVNPDFIVCDEPVSALDVSIQAQVLNTMQELQEEFGLTYLFIAHDLSVIRHISDRVAVMYLGQLAELGEAEQVFERPKHPYTEALLDSIPVPDPRATGTRNVLSGDVPSPIDPPSGCRFRTRCPKLIPPTEYDFAEGDWPAIRSFLRAVDNRSFEPADEAAIRTQFFDGGVPDGEAGRVVSAAIEDVLTEDWERATARLQEQFAERSVCAGEHPEYEIESSDGDDSHYVACHLHRD